MKLVETDAEGPSAEAAIVTPPRPEKRRVSISLLFTVSVLVATVVTIYTVFPARDNELLTVALEQHRLHHQDALAWDLTAPSDPALRAWVLAVVGRDAPLPKDLPALGAASISVFHRPAAVLRYQLGSAEVTYVLQRVHSVSPGAAERVSDGLHAFQWREGNWLAVAVGPDGERGWLTAAQRR